LVALVRKTTDGSGSGATSHDTVFSDYRAIMSSSTISDASGRLEIKADLQDVAHQIHEEFADRLDPREVDECLTRVAAKFDDAKVRAFVPLLVRRYVADELHEHLGRAET